MYLTSIMLILVLLALLGLISMVFSLSGAAFVLEIIFLAALVGWIFRMIMSKKHNTREMFLFFALILVNNVVLYFSLREFSTMLLVFIVAFIGLILSVSKMNKKKKMPVKVYETKEAKEETAKTTKKKAKKTTKKKAKKKTKKKKKSSKK